jgi:lipoate-protein ligase B
MISRDLGRLPYRDAWAIQEQAHEAVVAGGGEQLLLVEHPPVITFGRRPGGDKNLLVGKERLAALNVELVESDRGGDVTFHGPGQIVAYPIVRLIDHHLSVGAYVRRLEDIVIAALGEFGVSGQKDESAIGVWVEEGGALAKICALGVRIRQGVSLHGIALNVETDLSYFNLIVPCGLAARGVTSMRRLLQDRTPTLQAVRETLTLRMLKSFAPAGSPSIQIG